MDRDRAEELAAEIVVDLDLSDLSDLLGDEISDAATDAASDALEDVADVGGIEDLPDSIVDQVNERAVSAARDQAAELVTQIDDSTRQMLRDLIADGLEDNLGLDDVADSIVDAAAFSDERADLIANTEIADANSDGALEGYISARDDLGVDVKKAWLLGPNPCATCQENADAGPIDLDDDFPSGDDAPTAHPRCECSLVPVIGEDDDDNNQDQDRGSIDVEQSARSELAKGAVDDEARDDHGRWTSGSGGESDGVSPHVSWINGYEGAEFHSTTDNVHEDTVGSFENVENAASVLERASSEASDLESEGPEILKEYGEDSEEYEEWNEQDADAKDELKNAVIGVRDAFSDNYKFARDTLNGVDKSLANYGENNIESATGGTPEPLPTPVGGKLWGTISVADAEGIHALASASLDKLADAGGIVANAHDALGEASTHAESVSDEESGISDVYGSDSKEFAEWSSRNDVATSEVARTAVDFRNAVASYGDLSRAASKQITRLIAPYSDPFNAAKSVDEQRDGHGRWTSGGSTTVVHVVTETRDGLVQVIGVHEDPSYATAQARARNDDEQPGGAVNQVHAVPVTGDVASSNRRVDVVASPDDDGVGAVVHGAFTSPTAAATTRSDVLQSKWSEYDEDDVGPYPGDRAASTFFNDNYGAPAVVHARDLMVFPRLSSVGKRDVDDETRDTHGRWTAGASGLVDAAREAAGWIRENAGKIAGSERTRELIAEGLAGIINHASGTTIEPDANKIIDQVLDNLVVNLKVSRDVAIDQLRSASRVLIRTRLAKGRDAVLALLRRVRDALDNHQI